MRTTEGITTEATTTLNNVGNSTQNELDLPSTPRKNDEIADGSTEKRSTEKENGGNTSHNKSSQKGGYNNSATGMNNTKEKAEWDNDNDATQEINTAFNETKRPDTKKIDDAE